METNKIFTNDWKIVLPDTNLVVIPVTPSNAITYIKVSFKPETAEIQDTHVKYLTQHYIESRIKREYLRVLVLQNEEIVGFDALGKFSQPTDEIQTVNVGIAFVPGFLGKGFGAKFLRVLLRLSCEIQTDQVQMGTLLDNTAMRALAKKFGLTETLGIVDRENGGRIAEVMYLNIDRNAFRDVPLDVTFGEEVVVL
ncbi:hypothetical protein HK100_012389 [Physocladia obscura]|uniref:N-acetyltransferase domain-containing protein n=1 Tax=Physocladia obscura TaxID=109957 RepID=A0AAD5XGA3_9FUNG|nr:hypothetical protein HK100_012389 [Physocladia obscura]